MEYSIIFLIIIAIVIIQIRLAWKNYKQIVLYKKSIQNIDQLSTFETSIYQESEIAKENFVVNIDFENE